MNQYVHIFFATAENGQSIIITATFYYSRMPKQRCCLTKLAFYTYSSGAPLCCEFVALHYRKYSTYFSIEVEKDIALYYFVVRIEADYDVRRRKGFITAALYLQRNQDTHLIIQGQSLTIRKLSQIDSGFAIKTNSMLRDRPFSCSTFVRGVGKITVTCLRLHCWPILQMQSIRFCVNQLPNIQIPLLAH